MENENLSVLHKITQHSCGRLEHDQNSGPLIFVFTN